MKKKVVLAVAFVLLVLSSVVLSSNSADAKTYKRKIIDNWEFKNVKCHYDDDLYLKVDKKTKYTFKTNNPNIIDVDKNGHVTFKAIGNASVFAVSPTGREYECFVKVRPYVFTTDENLTIKVGETVRPILNVGDAPIPENFYYNITKPNTYRDVVKIDFEDGKCTGTITGVAPGELCISIWWQEMHCSFTVTVVE